MFILHIDSVPIIVKYCVFVSISCLFSHVASTFEKIDVRVYFYRVYFHFGAVKPTVLSDENRHGNRCGEK